MNNKDSLVIETKRLVLKKVNTSDSAFFLKLLNSPKWVEYIGDKGVNNLEDSSNYILNSLTSSYDKLGYGLYKMCLKEDNLSIGICGFIKREYLQKADIGFAVLPKYEGLGYTTEAALATIEFGKNQLGFDEILAITNEENTSSQKLLLKIGLYKIGTVQPDNSKNHLLLFSNLNPNI